MTMPDDSSPVFYLGSAEFSGDFARPRACWPQGRLRGPDSREYVWVRIAPPVIGQPFGVGNDLEDLVLSPRHQGASLSPPTDFPTAVQVYIARSPDVLRARSFEVKDVEMAAWCEIYRTEEAAAAAAE